MTDTPKPAREWTAKWDFKSEQIVLDKYDGQFFSPKLEQHELLGIRVIEKSAFEQLQKRCESLDALCKALAPEKVNQGIQSMGLEISALKQELAAAREEIARLNFRNQEDVSVNEGLLQEIERLNHVINYDMPHPQLAQANARITQLESALKKQSEMHNRALKESNVNNECWCDCCEVIKGRE